MVAGRLKKILLILPEYSSGKILGINPEMYMLTIGIQLKIYSSVGKNRIKKLISISDLLHILLFELHFLCC